MAKKDISSYITEVPREADQPVVAVIVTRNPGFWLEEALTSFYQQDYANLSSLVIDARSDKDPLPRIAKVFPTAFVRKLSRNTGYAVATNRALRIVQGASYFLLCHDDIVLPPDAISKMVRKAQEFDAGIVTPTFVLWETPDFLLEAGGSIDTLGAFLPNVDKGDRDHGQTDSIVFTFVAPSGCMLVRADLFIQLGGFDEFIREHGEDIDLSARTTLAGEKIVIAHDVKVRHLQAQEASLRDKGFEYEDVQEELTFETQQEKQNQKVLHAILQRRRHRLRTMLKASSASRALFILILSLLLTCGECGYALLFRQKKYASIVAKAWIWNVIHWRSLVRARRRARKIKRIADTDFQRNLGSSRKRLQEVFRKELYLRKQQLSLEKKEIEKKSGVKIVLAVVYALLACFWVKAALTLFSNNTFSFGTWSVFYHMIPLQDPSLLLQQVFLLGSITDGRLIDFYPISSIVMAGVGFFFGSLRENAPFLLAISMLPLGVWSIAKLVQPLKNKTVMFATIFFYATTLLPYKALQQGDWNVLFGYGFLPFLFLFSLRIYGEEPYEHKASVVRFGFRRHRRMQDEDEQGELLVSSSSVTYKGIDHASSYQESSPVKIDNTAVLAKGAKPSMQDFLFGKILPFGLVLAFCNVFLPQSLIYISICSFALALSGFFMRRSINQNFSFLFLTLLSGIFSLVLQVTSFLDVGQDGIAVAQKISFLWESSFHHGFLYQNPLLGENEHGVLSSILRLSSERDIKSLGGFILLLFSLFGLLSKQKRNFLWSCRLWVLYIFCISFMWLSQKELLGPVELDAATGFLLLGIFLSFNASLGFFALLQNISHQKVMYKKIGIGCISVVALLSLFPVEQYLFQEGSFKKADVRLLDWMKEEKDAPFFVLWLGEEGSIPGYTLSLSEEGSFASGSQVSMSIAYRDAIPKGFGEGPLYGDFSLSLQDEIVKGLHEGNVLLGKKVAPFSIKYIVTPSQEKVLSRDEQQLIDKLFSSNGSIRERTNIEVFLENQLDLKKVTSDPRFGVFKNTAFEADSYPTKKSLSFSKEEGTLFIRSVQSVVLFLWTISLIALIRYRPHKGSLV